MTAEEENRVNKVTASLVGENTTRYALSSDQMHAAIQQYARKYFDANNKCVKIKSNLAYDASRPDKEVFTGWVEITRPNE